jgi:TolA-binding protein
MTSRCDEFVESVLDLAYGEIDSPAAERLREHAAGCSACRETLERLLLTRRLAAQLPPIEAWNAGREELFGMARRAAAGFAADRAARPETESAGSLPVFVERGPGLLDRLRLALLRPAFATAAAAGLVLAVALVLYHRGAGPIDGSEVDSSAPFLGPIDAARRPASGQDRAAPPSAPVGSSADAPSGADGPFDSVAPVAAEPSLGLLGTGRGGGGKTAARGAAPGLGTLGPEARRETAPAPVTSLARAEGGAAEAAADSWPSARDDEADRDAPPRAESGDAAAAPAKQAAAGSPGAGGGFAGDGESSYQTALAAYQRGDCAAAMPLFERVLGNPGIASGTRASALHHLALCEKRAGRCSQAVRRYDGLLADYPGYGRRPEALWESAACHRRLGDLDEARRRLVDLAGHATWRERAFEELRVIDQLGGGQP